MIISVLISVGQSRRWCWTRIGGFSVNLCLISIHLPISLLLIYVFKYRHIFPECTYISISTLVSNYYLPLKEPTFPGKRVNLRAVPGTVKNEPRTSSGSRK